MNKKLMAVLTLMTIASSAFAQVGLPGGKRKLPDVPDIAAFRVERNINILQVMPCDPDTGGVQQGGGKVLLPAGITPTTWCLTGPSFDAKGNEVSAVTPELDFPACRFVGGVLCLDPGPNGDFANWLTNCPTFEGMPTDPAIQGVKLRKLEPRQPKCPDIYPGVDFTQTGVSGIRTFWALKYTPCNTVFTLDLEYGCVSRTFPRRIIQVRTARYNFRVIARADTLRWVIEALHCQPLGVCEIPCITDEGLFALLLKQADTVAATAAAAKMGSSAALLALNDALDTMEATVVKYAFFTPTVWSYSEKLGALIPCAIFTADRNGVATPAHFIPGNKTIDRFGFGIVDTFEHPCVCKLISDIVCIKADLIGTDP